MDCLLHFARCNIRPGSSPTGRVQLCAYVHGWTDRGANSHGELFGQERLCTWLRQSVNKHKNSRRIVRDFLTELKSFQAQAGLSDDQTFLVLADESKARSKPPKTDADFSVIVPAPAVAVAVK